jgi:hypothetical protein
MRNVMWKFPLKSGVSEQEINVPCGGEMVDGARFLSAQMQRGTLTLWAMVNADLEPVAFRVRIVGTGEKSTDFSSMIYVSTVQDGDAVWHVFVDRVK